LLQRQMEALDTEGDGIYGKKKRGMSEINEDDNDYTKCKKMVYQEKKRRIDSGEDPANCLISKEEIKRIADDNELDIGPEEVDQIYEEQKTWKFNGFDEKQKQLSKDEINDEIERLKRENGGELTKEQLKELLARGDLTEEEMKQLAIANGIELNVDDLNEIKDKKEERKKQAVLWEHIER